MPEETIATALIGAGGAAVGAVITVLGPVIVDQFDLRGLDRDQREREDSLRGLWTGIVRDSISGDEDDCSLQITVKRGNVGGSGSLSIKPNASFGRLDVRFSLEGRLVNGNFLQMNYRDARHGSINIGSVILSLDPRSTTLSGKYAGLGILAGRIVSGDVVLERES